MAIKEIAKEIVQDFRDTPLPLIWQAVWTRCRGQMIAIAYLTGFVTAALLRDPAQMIATFVAFVALIVLTIKVYQAAKEALIEEEKGGEKV